MMLLYVFNEITIKEKVTKIDDTSREKIVNSLYMIREKKIKPLFI